MTDDNNLSLNPEELEETAENTLDEVSNQIVEDLLEGINGDPDRRKEIEDSIAEPDPEPIETDGEGGDEEPVEKLEAGKAIDWDSKRPELNTNKKRRVSKDIFASLMEDVRAVESGGKPKDQEIIYEIEVEPEKKVIESDELQEELARQEEMKRQIAEKHGLKIDDSTTENTAESPEDVEDSPKVEDTEPNEDKQIDEVQPVEGSDQGETITTGDSGDESSDPLSGLEDFGQEFTTTEPEDESNIEMPTFGEEEGEDGTSSLSEFSEIDGIDFPMDGGDVSSSALDDILTSEGSETNFDEAFEEAAISAKAKVDSSNPVNQLPQTEIDVDDIFKNDITSPPEYDKNIDHIPDGASNEGMELEDIDTLETKEFTRSELKPVPTITSEFDDLTPIESSSDEADSLPSLDTFDMPLSNEFITEFDSIPDMESIEDEPFEEPGEVKVVSAPAGDYQPQSRQSDDEEFDDDIEITEEEIHLILNSLSKLPPGLKYVAEDTIINEKLPYNDLQWLTENLIQKAPEEDIRNFLEDRGIEIPDDDDIHRYTPPPVERQSSVAHSPKPGRGKGRWVIKNGKRTWVPDGKDSGRGTKKPLPAIVKLAAAAIIVASIGAAVWFFAIEPAQEREKNTNEALAFVKMGHTTEGVKKFFKAQEGSLDMEKVKELIKILNEKGDPESLNLATEIAGIDDPSGEDFRRRYIEGKSDKPGAEEVMDKGAIKNFPEIKPDPKDKEIHYLISETYIRKAYLASYSGLQSKWNDIDTFFGLALEKGYNKLDRTDDEVLDKKAKAYILWGKLLRKKPKSNDYKKRFKEAENIYKKIQADDYENPYALYGYLRLAIARGDNTDYVKAIYKQIEHYDLSYIDPEALSEYAYLISKDYQNRKEARKILNNVIENANPPYPKAYYYLGDLYAQNNDYSKSNESYVKGIYAFYYNQTIGVEQFLEQINEESDPEKRSEIQTDETVKAIEKIKADTNPENSKLQSMIFNNLGENFLVESKKLRSKVEQERHKKERLIKIARKNFFLAIQKDPNNYKPWKNIGDLYYEKNINNIKEFMKQIGSSTAHGKASLAQLKEKLKLYAKPRKCYEIAVSLTINHGNYKPITARNLWYQLEKGVEEENIDPVLFYKLGYIYFKEKNYKFAKEIWSIIKTKPEYKFNPTLNFSIANAYLRLNQFGEAIRHYENVISYYSNTAEKYKNNPDPNSLRQNEVFAKLAKSENNLGVAYHLIGEKTKETRFRDYAILHYYQAREYSTKLNNSVFVQQEQLNQDRIFNNISFIKHDNIKLKSRKVTDPVSKEDVSLKNPKDYMLIEDLESELKLN